MTKEKRAGEVVETSDDTTDISQRQKESQAIADFEQFLSDNTGDIQITSKVSYNMRTVVENNEKMYHAMFDNAMDGSFKKIYYRISFIIFRTLYQYLVGTVDSKSLLMRSENGKAIPLVQVLKMAVHTHLKRTGFAKFVNDLAFFVKDGTTYVKMVDDKPEIVSNLNIIAPEYEPDVQKTGLAEKVLYSWEMMLSKKEDWSAHWHEIEELHKVMKINGVSDFVVYEHWRIFDFGKKGYHKGCRLFLDNNLTSAQDRKRNPQPIEWQPYVLLEEFVTPFKKKRTSKRLIKKLGEWEELYPYKPLSFIDVPGRRISFSIFELLAGIQESYNRKMNLHDKKDIMDLMGIFKHKRGRKNSSVTQQLLQNIESGTVVDMEMDEDIERLVIDTKTGELIGNVNHLFDLAKQITGVNAQAIGAEAPASMLATTAVINKQSQQTTYDYATEKIGIFLTEFFTDFYMPVILEELDYKEIVEIVGDPTEIKELDEIFVTEQVNNAAQEYTDKMGFGPTEEEYIAEKQRLLSEQSKNGESRFIDWKKEVTENIAYYIEFYMDNESFDKNVEIQNLIALKNSPTFTGSQEKVDEAIFDLLNKNPKQFRKSPEEAQKELEMMQQKAMVEQGVMPNQSPVSPISNGTQQFAQANQMG